MKRFSVRIWGRDILGGVGVVRVLGMVGREEDGWRCRCKEIWSCYRPVHQVFRVVVAS